MYQTPYYNACTLNTAVTLDTAVLLQSQHAIKPLENKQATGLKTVGSPYAMNTEHVLYGRFPFPVQQMCLYLIQDEAI